VYIDIHDANSLIPFLLKIKHLHWSRV